MPGSNFEAQKPSKQDKKRTQNIDRKSTFLVFFNFEDFKG